MLLRVVTACLLLLASFGTGRAELRGHGGPVRALAILPDGKIAVSGSFDQSAIVWNIQRGEALHVFRFHAGAVNAVAALPDGRFATAGEDGRIALWTVGATEPTQVFPAHSGLIAGLSVSPGHRRLASASWDGTARLTDLGTGDGRILEGHTGPVNAVAFRPSGEVVSAGHDGTVRIWAAPGEAPRIVALGAPVNALAATPDGEIVAGGADGVLRFLRADGSPRTEMDLQSGPILGLALSPDGNRIAAAVLGGSVAILDRSTAQLVMRLVGPGLPVWSLAFAPDGRELLTGGSDRLVRRWDARSGEHIGPVVMARPPDLLAVAGDERGAEVFKACAACHTLTPDGGNRAGPTLHGIFGRRIATLPGYDFSPALKALDIVWNAETIGKLFEIGPARYTPGTKMPEQTVTAEDRAALIAFLEKATQPRP